MGAARALGENAALAMDHLVRPAITLRRFDSPNPNAAIMAVAGFAAEKTLTEPALVESARHLLADRMATIKPSDLERSIDRAAQIAARDAAEARRHAALPRVHVMADETARFHDALQLASVPPEKFAAWWLPLGECGVTEIRTIGDNRVVVVVASPRLPQLMDANASNEARRAARVVAGPTADVEFRQAVAVSAAGGSRQVPHHSAAGSAGEM